MLKPPEVMVTENDIAREIVDAAFKIHKRLGPGLLESVYEAVLAFELERRGLEVERQRPVAVNYDGLVLDIGFRVDLIVNDKVIIELKSIEQVAPVHKKQLLTYLRVADKRLGLLINFGAELIKDGIISHKGAKKSHVRSLCDLCAFVRGFVLLS